MLMFRDFSELERIEAFELGVVHSHLVRCFQQVILEILVSRQDHLGVGGFKTAGLALRPGNAAELGKSGVVSETGDIANLGEKSGAVDRPDAGDGGKAVGE